MTYFMHVYPWQGSSLFIHRNRWMYEDAKKLGLFWNRLCQKVKENKERKFYSLHGKLWGIDIVRET